jgi:hypothetical protein
MDVALEARRESETASAEKTWKREGLNPRWRPGDSRSRETEEQS